MYTPTYAGDCPLCDSQLSQIKRGKRFFNYCKKCQYEEEIFIDKNLKHEDRIKKEFLNWMIKNCHLSASTARNYLSNLNSAVEMYNKRKEQKINPYNIDINNINILNDILSCIDVFFYNSALLGGINNYKAALKRYIDFLQKDEIAVQNVDFSLTSIDEIKKELSPALIKDLLKKYFLEKYQTVQEIDIMKIINQYSIDINPIVSTQLSEINKIKTRLPKWFNNPQQYNSVILYTFLHLRDPSKGYVLYDDLEKYSNLGNKFQGNFNQMKNFGDTNHGKVFEQHGNYVYLWKEIEDYVLKLYENYK